MATAKTKKCPHCKKREVERRGVCINCYAAMRRRIRAGATTDEMLVELGALLPASRGGRKPSGGGAVIDRLLGK